MRQFDSGVSKSRDRLQSCAEVGEALLHFDFLRETARHACMNMNASGRWPRRPWHIRRGCGFGGKSGESQEWSAMRTSRAADLTC